ncbi:hypothetical protein [uncultured Dechloromonas sp.]|uniref:hypothetical protein n=1 Tax=uncultured Dechloromonas sp. TaxID=171719 RepID=UPI0025E90EC0|nr:hypothetical protein [uncultured Dechloromonas sp.]
MAIASLAASAAVSLVGSIARSLTSSSRPAASSAGRVEDSAVTTISQAARDRLAAEASGAKATYDTMQGSQALDIDAYFTPDPSRPLLSLPLLAPTRNNIDALSRHVSAAMPELLARYGIPQAPASIAYDTNGQMQLPADYPYAAQFRGAMAENPVLARQMSTINALSSQMNGMEKAMSFDAEYRAAKTPAELAAVITKYRSLLDGNLPPAAIALHFDNQGRLSVTADNQALAA